MIPAEQKAEIRRELVEAEIEGLRMSMRLEQPETVATKQPECPYPMNSPLYHAWYRGRIAGRELWQEVFNG